MFVKKVSDNYYAIVEVKSGLIIKIFNSFSEAIEYLKELS
jgi:prefoldin subunit 5